MAQMITIMGAMLGLVTALVGYFGFDLSFLTAFAIWAASGPVAAVLGFAAFTTPTSARNRPHSSAFDAAA